jgi:two-component system cell cycle response regulator
VELVGSAGAALQRGRGAAFDLIILALRLTGEDGLRLCSQLRSQEETRHVPILLVLDEGDLQHIAKGLDIGVTDYLVRPIDKAELRARTRTQIRRRRYHDRLRNMLESSVSLAYTDTLTGVYNRRYMDDHLKHKIAEIAETAKPVSVMIFDLDHFKMINDTYGHPVGDRVLKGVAERVATSIRDIDLLARYGGEEFVVIMPSTPVEVAATVAQRLCDRLAEKTFAIPGRADGLSVTTSVGVATTIDPTVTVDGLLARADAALYAAKQAGRNRVCVADGDMPAGDGNAKHTAGAA